MNVRQRKNKPTTPTLTEKELVMPEYDILVDKYISMGYPADRAKDYATLDWMDEADECDAKRNYQRELIQRTLGMVARRRVA